MVTGKLAGPYVFPPKPEKIDFIGFKSPQNEPEDKPRGPSKCVGGTVYVGAECTKTS